MGKAQLREWDLLAACRRMTAVPSACRYRSAPMKGSKDSSGVRLPALLISYEGAVPPNAESTLEALDAIECATAVAHRRFVVAGTGDVSLARTDAIALRSIEGIRSIELDPGLVVGLNSDGSCRLKDEESPMQAAPAEAAKAASDKALSVSIADEAGWFQRIGGAVAHKAVGNARAVTVAILDSAVAVDDDYLRDWIWTDDDRRCNGMQKDGAQRPDDCNGWDFVRETANPGGGAAESHGTAVAALIRQMTSQPGSRVRIMPLRVHAEGSEMSTALIARGIFFAVDRRADVINASLYAWNDSEIFVRAIEAARGQNIPIVVAAGNDGTDLKLKKRWPAYYALTYPNVIAVQGIGDSSRSDFASGLGLLAAPAGRMCATPASGETPTRFCIRDTSGAAAIVSGAVALTLTDGRWSYHSMPSQLSQILMSHSTPIRLPPNATNPAAQLQFNVLDLSFFRRPE
jgi:hypothetical protein